MQTDNFSPLTSQVRHAESETLKAETGSAEALSVASGWAQWGFGSERFGFILSLIFQVLTCPIRKFWRRLLSFRSYTGPVNPYDYYVRSRQGRRY